MKKHITYVQTSFGGGSYKLTIESEEGATTSSAGIYTIENATIVKCEYGGSHPIIKEKENYSRLNIPTQNTLLVEKVFEY